MTYKQFEDLPVWQTAADLYEQVEKLLQSGGFGATYGYRNQLDRAALSVSNNIAEGFERGTTRELLQFLYIARGSAGEVRSMILLKQRRARREGWLTSLQAQVANIHSLAESCSRQLKGWADSLQNSDIPGQRHLNDRTRSEHDKRKRAEAFRKKTLAMLPKNHPLRREAERKGII